jgi:hypothetical protein
MAERGVSELVSVDLAHADRDTVVGYDQEAGAGGVGDLAEQSTEPIDIGVVERRVDLVEDANRRGIGEKNREEQSERRQRLLKEKASDARADCIERKKVMRSRELARLMPSWSPNCPDWDPAPSTPCRRCRLAMCPSSPAQAIREERRKRLFAGRVELRTAAQCLAGICANDRVIWRTVLSQRSFRER